MSHASFSFSTGLWSLMGLLMVAFVPAPIAAQQPADSIRAEALRDYHGPDRTGKDGPLAKAGLDLLVLYHEYQAFQQRGDDTFSPSVAGSRVTDGHVAIDAIATVEARQLRADLQELGLKNAAAAGRVVSGRLPIDQIPALAQLESLRGVALSQVKTHGDVSRPGPMKKAPEAVGEHSEETPSEKEPGEVGILLFLLGVLGILILTEL